MSVYINNAYVYCFVAHVRRICAAHWSTEAETFTNSTMERSSMFSIVEALNGASALL